MPTLAPTEQYGEITWLGTVPPDTGLRSVATAEMRLTYAGAEGEAHSGVTRASCVRVKSLWKQGTEIRNERQLSVMSQEEIDAIAAKGSCEFVTDVAAELPLIAILSLCGIPMEDKQQFFDWTNTMIFTEDEDMSGEEGAVAVDFAGAEEIV